MKRILGLFMLIAFVAFAFDTPCTAKCATDNDVGINYVILAQVDVIAEQVQIAESNQIKIIVKTAMPVELIKEVAEVEFYRKTYNLMGIYTYNYNWHFTNKHLFLHRLSASKL